MTDFVTLDFETANFQRSSICSVGLICVEEGIIVDRFYSLIRPYPDFYSRRNSEIHGLTSVDTRSSPRFDEVWPLLYARMEGLPLFAHNSPFDKGCLQAALLHYRLPVPDFHFYCTYRLARKLYPRLENHRLHTVAAHCGYDLEHHHHALADAEACAIVALRMMNQQQAVSPEELMKMAYRK